MDVLALVIGAPQTLGQHGRALGLELGEPAVPGALLNVMRIMAFGAHEPALLAVARPLADALAVDAVAPVPVNRAMALAAQLLRFIEADRLAEVVYQLVARGRMMAVQTPDGAAAVLKIECVGHNVLVHRERARVLVLRRRRVGSVMAGPPAPGHEGGVVLARAGH